MVSPGRSLPRVLHITRHRPSGLASMKQPLPVPARAVPAADQPGGHDPRVVNHQAVALPEDFGQIADVLVVQRVGATVHHQQPGVAPANHRRLGNQPLRQIVVVLVQFRHGALYPRMVRSSGFSRLPKAGFGGLATG